MRDATVQRRLQTELNRMFPHRYPKPSPRSLTLIFLLLGALTFAAFATPTNATSNNGTVKVHDGPTADPETRNEPHVDCDFWVEGFNMKADHGSIEVFSWPPTGNKELVLTSTWTADDGEPEHHFLAGPYELTSGHYRLEASNTGDHTKNKMFWVECEEQEEPECGEPGAPPCPEPPCGQPGGEPCPEEPPCGEPGGEPCPEEPPCGEPGGEPCPEEPPCGEPGGEPCPEEPPCGEPGGEPCPEEPPCGEPGGEPCPEEPPCGEPGGEPCPEEPPCGEPGGEPCPEEPALECPTDLEATANADETVTLTWTVAAGSDGTNVYRAVGDGDFEYVTTLDEGVDTYVDSSTSSGTTYAYTVTGLFGNEESEDCGIVEVAAIPVFPTTMGFALATGLGAAVYVVAARRRKD